MRTNGGPLPAIFSILMSLVRAIRTIYSYSSWPKNRCFVALRCVLIFCSVKWTIERVFTQMDIIVCVR